MNEENKLTFKIKDWIIALAIVCIMGLIGNFIGYDHLGFGESFPGMAALFIIGLVSLILEHLLPSKFPTIAYTSIVGMVAALPFSPFAGFIIENVGKISLMAVVTPILAYAGLTVGKDWGLFKKLGPKAILVGFVVIFGTYFWSAVIAQFAMKLQGII